MMDVRPAVESLDRERLLEDERRILELIATGARLTETLGELCRTLDEQIGLMSAVYLLNREGDRLLLAAGPNLPELWRDVTRSWRVAPTAGACGAALHARARVVVPDVLESPLFADGDELARLAGIRSVWSTPFFSKEGRILGTFAVVGRQPGTPTDAEIDLVGRATRLASIAAARDVTDRELRESEVRFSTAFYASPVCMTITRVTDGRLLYVNDAFVRIFGYSRGEAVGRTAMDLGLFVDPSDPARLVQLFDERRLHDVEISTRTKSGEIVDVVASVQRIEVLGEDGLLGIAVPITERKRVEAQLRRSEHLLAEAQRLAHIGSWNLDVRTRTVGWSDELYRIFGVAPGSINPQSDAMAFIDPDDRPSILRAVERTLQTKEPYEFFYRIRRPDGEARILHTHGCAVSDDDGTPIGVFGTTQDVTERKQAEDALRRSEELLRLVLEAIPVGVAVVDPVGNIILKNPVSNRIWGTVIESGSDRYAASKAWWHDTGERIASDDWASVRACTKGETSINEVIDIEAFDGTRKIIRNSAVPVRDERQEIVGAVIINEDISGTKAAEAALEASVAQMQALATRLMLVQDDERRRIARLLHETTAQELVGLKMLLSRLNRTSDRLSDAERALLDESVDLAERSIGGVRTLSYLLHPPFLDEAGLLAAVRWYAEGFAKRSAIEVTLDLPDTFERLSQDAETALFRIIQEALINIHHHAESSTAHIRLHVEGRELALEIHDRGKGMSPELVAQLLSAGGAFGVGIASMRERLQQFGGTLDIDTSERGTVIHARMPLPAVS